MAPLALIPLLLCAWLVPPGSCPDQEPIRLGLFLAADPDLAADMKAGAEAALAALNEPALTLVTRQAGAGWDGGARRAAALVYEDKALLVIAPPDAREAHDVALVTTKSRTPVLHLSGDPRLRHSRVPWSFCLAPSEGSSTDLRGATQDAVTLAARAALAARRGPTSLLHSLQTQITGGEEPVPPRSNPLPPPQALHHQPSLAPAPVISSPSARCPEDSPRSPKP